MHGRTDLTGEAKQQPSVPGGTQQIVSFDSIKQLLIIDNPNLGTADSWYRLGEDYYSGKNGKNQDRTKAGACYKRALDFDSNHVHSNYVLGWLYHHGEGVSQNLNAAIKHYVKSAQADHFDSIKQLLIIGNPNLGTADLWCTLGDNYYSGRNGKKENRVKARACYERALKFDSNHVDSNYSLGWLYHHGEGVNQNPHEAQKYYEKSAQADHFDSIKQLLIIENPDVDTADLWSTLGNDYYFGKDGKEQDRIKARACYEIALMYDSNHVNSNYNLGWLYQHGQGVSKNLDEAQKYYEKNAKANHFDSIKQLLIIENPDLGKASFRPILQQQNFNYWGGSAHHSLYGLFRDNLITPLQSNAQLTMSLVATQLMTLTQLDLSGIRRQAEHPHVLRELTHAWIALLDRGKQLFLQRLSLANNLIDAADMPLLLAFLDKYKELSSLNLSGNPLGGQHSLKDSSFWSWQQSPIQKPSGVSQLAQGLKNYPALKQLGLNNVGLNESDQPHLMNLVQHSPLLEVLIEQNPNLQGEKLEHLSERLADTALNRKRRKYLEPESPRSLLLALPVPLKKLAAKYSLTILEPARQSLSLSVTEEKRSMAASHTVDTDSLPALIEDYHTLHDFLIEMANLFKKSTTNTLDSTMRGEKKWTASERLQAGAIRFIEKMPKKINKLTNFAALSKELDGIVDVFVDWAHYDELKSIYLITSVDELLSKITKQVKLQAQATGTGILEPDYPAEGLPSKALIESKAKMLSLQGRWFRFEFHQTLHSFWLASVVMSSGMVQDTLSAQEHKKEQWKHLIKHGLLFIPTIGYFFHQAFHKIGVFKTLAETEIPRATVHTWELIESGRDLRALSSHQANTLDHEIEQRYQQLVTEQYHDQYDYSHHSIGDCFIGEADFFAKIEGVIYEFLRFHQPLKNHIDQCKPKAAMIIAAAYARHLIMGLKNGLFNPRSGEPILDRKTFIQRALAWLFYVPMEEMVFLNDLQGKPVLLDHWIRGAGLSLAYQKENKKQTVFFSWQHPDGKSNIVEIAAESEKHAYYSHFKSAKWQHQSEPGRFGFRLALPIEVAHLKNLLQSRAQETESKETTAASIRILPDLKSVNFQVAPITYRELVPFRDQLIVEDVEAWQPVEDRVAVLENKLEKQEEKVKNLEDIVKKQAKENDQLKEKVEEILKKTVGNLPTRSPETEEKQEANRARETVSVGNNRNTIFKQTSSAATHQNTSNNSHKNGGFSP